MPRVSSAHVCIYVWMIGVAVMLAQKNGEVAIYIVRLMGPSCIALRGFGAALLVFRV